MKIVIDKSIPFTEGAFKLDMTRVGNLLGMVSDREFGQIFLTDSNKVRTESIVDALTTDRTYIEAEGGAFRIIDE